MARKGVAILREIAMVNASAAPQAVKIRMLRELNDELEVLYAPPAEDKQLDLPLAPVTAVDSKRKA